MIDIYISYISIIYVIVLTHVAYLMKSHVSDPVIILLVCSYSMRQVKPATSEKCIITRQFSLWLEYRMYNLDEWVHSQYFTL